MTDPESEVWYFAVENNEDIISEDEKTVVISMTAYRAMESSINFSIKRNKKYKVRTGYKLLSDSKTRIDARDFNEF